MIWQHMCFCTIASVGADDCSVHVTRSNEGIPCSARLQARMKHSLAPLSGASYRPCVQLKSQLHPADPPHQRQSSSVQRPASQMPTACKDWKQCGTLKPGQELIVALESTTKLERSFLASGSSAVYACHQDESIRSSSWSLQGTFRPSKLQLRSLLSSRFICARSSSTP